MTDYFAILGQKREPFLDPGALKEIFLRLSSECHPDKSAAENRDLAGQKFTEMNAAYNCLRDPKTRLAHFLELETGKPPVLVQSMPGGLMDHFAQVAQICGRADSTLRKRQGLSSPVVKAQCFQEALGLSEQISMLQRILQHQRDSLVEELRVLPALDGETDRPALLARIEEVYAAYSYLSRWSHQLQERFVQLASV